MKDLIIIGAGPIGLYASTLASLHSLKGIVLEGLDYVGGQLTTLYPQKEIIDLPGFEKIIAKDFISILHQQATNKPNSLPIHLGETVIKYEKNDYGFRVYTNKNIYETKTILIASGMGLFSPRKIGIDNEDKYTNIIYSLKDKEIYKDKIVTILGGGDSAVDWAIELSSIAKKVNIVHRREDFRAQSSSVELMMQKGVNVLKPCNVSSVIGEETVKQIVLTNINTTKEIVVDTDVIFVNYGLIPSPSPFSLESKNNAFITNSYNMTSEENIFAIGNICFYNGKVKNITSGFGEAVIAITKIDQIINPTKNIPIHF